jgi:hypothetical protein
LADAWWAVAGRNVPGVPAKAARARALHWYRLSLEGLEGLQKLAAEKRIAEAAALADREAVAAPQWISRDATYRLSSVAPNLGPLPDLLNGGGGGHHNGGFAFHTLKDERPFLVIDLGRTAVLTGFEIVNRKDGFLERARTLTMWVSMNPDGPWDEAWHATKAMPAWTISLERPTRARYVKLGLQVRDDFHLASVKLLGVWATP